MNDEIPSGFSKRKEIDVAWLKNQLNSGATIADITKLTGYSNDYIRKTIKELGLDLRKEAHISGLNDSKVEAVPDPQKSGCADRVRGKQELDICNYTDEVLKKMKHSQQLINDYYDKHRHEILKQTDAYPLWYKEQKQEIKYNGVLARIWSTIRSIIRPFRRKQQIPSSKKYHIAETGRIMIDPVWLKDQKDKGRSDREIAEEIGCSPATILKRRKKLGISYSQYKNH